MAEVTKGLFLTGIEPPEENFEKFNFSWWRCPDTSLTCYSDLPCQEASGIPRAPSITVQRAGLPDIDTARVLWSDPHNWEPYRPDQDLYLRFSELGGSASCVTFAQKQGLLGVKFWTAGGDAPTRYMEDSKAWSNEVWDLRQCLVLFEPLSVKDLAEIERRIQKDRLYHLDRQGSSQGWTRIPATALAQGPEAVVRWYLSKTVSEHLEDILPARMIDGQLRFWPRSLLAYLWYSFAQDIENKAEIGTCSACGKWFSARGKARGRAKKTCGKTCKCRSWDHSKHQRKPRNRKETQA